MKDRMQIAATKFTKRDLAKYPFLKENAEYVKKLDLKIEDLASPEFAEILLRAEERVAESILYAFVNRKTRNEEIEILSFPVAVILAIATENSFIKKRYALAEAKSTLQDIKEESKERVFALARSFGWSLDLNNDAEKPYDFVVSFTDYLRNTTHLRDKKWSLINRLLSDGKVYLKKDEAARLLSEEVRKHIERRLEAEGLPRFPPKMAEIADKLKKLSVEKIGKTELEDLPKTITQTAFPPCIEALYQAFSSGRHLSHIGRFTLTSFLINVGMPSHDVIELFKNITDFNERMTRYQVEHIAGERGSRTKYSTPRCDTLRTHGVCANPDKLCQGIRHPLGYYRKKLVQLR